MTSLSYLSLKFISKLNLDGEIEIILLPLNSTLLLILIIFIEHHLS